MSKQELSLKEEAILIYSFIGDFLSGRNWQEKPGRKMSDVAIITLVVLAGSKFSGNYQSALKWALDFPDLFPAGVLSKSRFSRRVGLISSLLPELQEALSAFLIESKKK